MKIGLLACALRNWGLCSSSTFCSRSSRRSTIYACRRADRIFGHKASANLRAIVQDFARRENRTIIVVTHDPVFAQAADRQIFIVDGHLEQPGKAAEHFEVGSRP